MISIDDWLEGNGLAKYARALAENDIGFNVLPHLTETDVDKLGLPVGARRRLMVAIEALAQRPRTAAAAPHEGSLVAREAERRQLTVMFCDLVGSTALAERLDPEELRDLMQAYQRACRGVIEKYDGHVAQYLGDGLMVYFGWPKAHEDDAVRAIRAGLEMTQAVSKLSGSNPISARVGIHTGLVVVGETGQGDASIPKAAVGETPNIAARLQGLAEPGAVVVSERTRALAGGLFDFADVGAQALKGVSEPVHLFKVVGARATDSRFDAAHGGVALAQLVGREEEVALLLRRWAQAKDGDGQVVLLCGEPGIGKSRISQTLRDRIGTEVHHRLRYQCSPYHTNSAFHPIIEQLQRAAHFSPADSLEEKLFKLEGLVGAAQADNLKAVPLIAGLLGIPAGEKYPPLQYTPQKQKDETIRVLGRQLETLSKQGPVLLTLEDAHWLDPSSLEAFDQLIQLAQTQRILVVITFRPEFVPKWSGQSHVTLLTLNRLGKRQAAELAKRVAGPKPLPDEVLEQIAAKTDGVPLFVEELTKSVLESGLVKEDADAYSLVAPLQAFAIPATLRDSLMARLDRLAPVKEVAQIGACIGREFDYQLLSVVSPAQGTKLDEALDELVSSGLVFQRGTPPEASYVFKHALVQDAAYESLLRSRRVQLHVQIARTLEQSFLDAQHSQPELLAHHYACADLPDRAAQYWEKAGAESVKRSAHREAIAHFRNALEALNRIPASAARSALELPLQTALGWAYVPVKSWTTPEAHAAFARAELLANELGDTASVLALLGLWAFHQSKGDQKISFQLSEKTLALAKRQGDSGLLVQATLAQALDLFLSGRFREAAHDLRETIRLYDARPHGALGHVFGADPKTLALANLCPVLCLLGYLDQAVATARQAGEFTRTLSNAFMTIVHIDRLAWIHGFRGEWTEVERIAEETHEMAIEQGSPVFIAASTYWIGRARAMGQGLKSGVEQMRAGLKGLSDLGTLIFHPMCEGGLAEALVRFEQYDEALALLEQAQGWARKNAEPYWDAELLRIRGDALLGRDRAALGAAEESYTRALEIARSQEAKLLELRAASSLARLWVGMGRRSEARAVLAPVYEWFTEGYDTLDLQEAKRLLDVLA